MKLCKKNWNLSGDRLEARASAPISALRFAIRSDLRSGHVFFGVKTWNPCFNEYLHCVSSFYPQKHMNSAKSSMSFSEYMTNKNKKLWECFHWNQAYGDFWPKNCFFGAWNHTIITKYPPCESEKKIPLLVSKNVPRPELETTLGFKKTGSK